MFGLDVTIPERDALLNVQLHGGSKGRQKATKRSCML